MRNYIEEDEWKIIESKFCEENAKASESIFSIANGLIGGRASFEETYSGPSMKGCYVAGIYYPDKTKVGWWKIGYPETFDKTPNAAYWMGVRIRVNGQELDLHQVNVTKFRRELNMQTGILTRQFQAVLPDGTSITAHIERMCCRFCPEMGVLRYAFSVNTQAEIHIDSYIDGNVLNEESNYGEKFWDPIKHDENSIVMRTRKSGFAVCWAMQNTINNLVKEEGENREGYVAEKFSGTVHPGQTITLCKYVGITCSLNHAEETLRSVALGHAERGVRQGAENLFEQQGKSWKEIWEQCDVVIEGDVKAQQGIRYCIFQALQSYSGEYPYLNIAPKGFSGEKYAGGTYWDTEAFCLPFVLAIMGKETARNLLLFRYNQLEKAIENAQKLGFRKGAALYPMATFNGQECHNEWEITFEEIHRNGAIAYAIYYYVQQTGDTGYLASNGFEVLVALARFWVQRVSFSERKQKYVILGVTGPNEYENNVNNNWYTNYMAAWTLRYAAETAEMLRIQYPNELQGVSDRIHFQHSEETTLWIKIAENMFFPENREQNILLQQEGYLDKEQVLVKDIPDTERPINQHWSWDRILRSPYIKQADVLQAFFFFPEKFEKETMERNFNYYEPRTVHESSLSPAVHAFVAARIGNKEKAYELFLRAARLDLDDYNCEIEEGLHITSTAGAWQAIVRGFAGLQINNAGEPLCNGILPEKWKSLKFKLLIRNKTYLIFINGQKTEWTEIQK